MLVKANMSGGGGNQVGVSNIKKWTKGLTPSWSGTPFKAKRVLLDASLYYNGNIRQKYANFNPTTGEIVTDKVYYTVQSAPTTWQESNLFYITITDNTVSLNRSVSGVTEFYTVFYITDGEFELE